MRSAAEYQTVRRLICAGLNDCAISKETGIPRKTISDWRHDRCTVLPREGSARREHTHDWSGLPPHAYCYVLGLYLGDGCLSQGTRTWKLRITLDLKYPAIISRCREAIDQLMPGQHAGVQPRKGCVDVWLYSKHWPCLLPQHGPGRKHHRLIRLEPWQQALIDQAPREFFLGLFHSDGCRVVANDRGVRSVRYHFSNRSEDIIGLFTAVLDSLDIPWTRSSKHIVSIYRKAAVAHLDAFAGPKAVAVPLTDVHYAA